ncbi:MAG: hypothetical protein FE834_09600, partial [Gammaproteobacteria bacterium]|nr:hypothetical protein [Gammaproteobacteria bacterium]
KAGAVKIGETVTYTFTFKEAVTGFDINDITISSGTKGTFTKVNDMTYTLVVTPKTDFEGDLVVSVAKDAATTINNDEKTLAASNTQVVDTIRPTIAITNDVSTLKAGETAIITFNFSETPVGFTNEDIRLEGGSLSTVTVNNTNDKVYTATFTPTADSTTAAEISVASDKFSDAAGNNNTIGALIASINIDTKIPVATFSGDVALTANLTMTFTEKVDKVVGKKIEIYNTREATAIQIITLKDDASDGVVINADNTITIDLANNLETGESYYVKIDAGAFKDTAGNAYAGITESTGDNAWAFTAASLTTSVTWSGFNVDSGNGINKTEYDNIIITGQIFNVGNAAQNVKIDTIKFIAESGTIENNKEYTNDIIPTNNNGTWVLTNAQIKTLGLVNDESYTIEVTLSASDSSGNSIRGTGQDNTIVLIDAIAPTITNITSSTADGGFKVDDIIDLQVT